MMTSITNWWVIHSPRDRLVIGLLIVAMLIVLGWFGVVQPLSNAIDTARESHAIAVERHAGITARITEVTALQLGGSSPATASPGRIDLIVAQSAAEQGFTLSRNDAVGDNQATIAIASASAPALLTWFGTLETQMINASDLSIRPNANGTVALNATFRRAQ